MAPAIGHDDGESDHNTVFIDTSLDTRLAMIFSESETVSDFKKKIAFEHRKMFPAIGDIKIECLKVKKRGNFFHLIDSMPVKWAFDSTKRDLFLSANAFRLEQNDGIQHSGKHAAGDQLALPWVTHSHSIERHDNYGSPSIHSKVVPFVNKKVLNADQPTSGDSCKDILKSVEEERSCNDKQFDHEIQEKLYTVYTEDISSKKRTCDGHNESSLKDALESGPSVKKKRKTQSVKSDAKASEENIASAYDDDKVTDNGASINKEDSFERKSKDKDLVDEINRINKGEKFSALDQVATVGTGIEGVGSENIGDVPMVVENNSQKEMSTGISQQEKDSELIRKSAMENEIDSSLTRTPYCKHNAAGVTATGHIKCSRKHKAVEKKVFSKSFTKKLRNRNNDAMESSSQDVGFISQECAHDKIDKYKDDSEVSLKQRPELKLSEKKKGNTSCENIGEGKRRKNNKRFKHGDYLAGDVFSAVPASDNDERKINEDSEKTLIDAKKGDDVIMNEVEVSVENTEEKSRKVFTDTNDAATVTNEENLLSYSESLMNNDAEEQNEKTDDMMKKKKKKKKKSKKSAGRNEDELITKPVDGDIFENVKEGESCLPDADKKDDMPSTVFDLVMDERKKDEDSGKLLLDAKKGDDVIANEVDISVENMEKKLGEEHKDTNDVATVTNEENLLPHSESLINNDVEVLTEKMVDTTKKKKKSKKSSGRNADESITKHVDGDIFENVKEGEGGLPDADRKEGDVSSSVFDSVNVEKQMNEVSGKSSLDAKKGDDIVNEVDISVENMGKKLGEDSKDTNDLATVTNEENLLLHSENLMHNDVEVSTEKMVDSTKKKKKKKSKKSIGRNEDESITKHVDGSIFENVKEGESGLPDADRKEGDMSSTVFDSVNDEKQMNEISEKSLLDAKELYDVIVDISVENLEKILGEEFKDTNDVATVTNEENLLPHSKSLMNIDAEVSNEKNLSLVNAQGVLDDLEKQNEKTDDATKKKKKIKKSSGRNKGESIAKHANHDVFENVKEDESSFFDVNRKDGTTSLMVLASAIYEMDKNSGKTSIDADKGVDVIVNEVGILSENMEEKMKEVIDVNDVANEEITTGKKVSQVNEQFENQNEMGDTTKKKKKRKTRKSAERIGDESITKNINRDISENVKEGKSNKSQDLPIKHQFAEVELESTKSQSVDHHHLPKKTLKDVTTSEVPKVNNKVDIPEYASVDYFALGLQPKKKASVDSRKVKDMMKTKDVSRKDQSQKLVSKNVNNKVSSNVLKDPNIANIEIKTRQITKNIDAQKTNKQQSNVGQTHAGTVKKKSVNSSQLVKRLLNAPGTIFGDDSDDNATANSDSRSRTPSGKSSSSSLESAYVIQSRRNRSLARIGKEGAGKNNINSEPGKLNYLLRSASGFKEAKARASSQVEDTESQPVDFVPDSQPMGK